MPGGRGLLLIAMDPSSVKHFQVWRLEVPSGEARPITSDVADYCGLTASADGRSLVSIRSEDRSDIWVAPFDDPKRASQITFGADNQDGGFGLAWAPAGGLVYTSLAGGTTDLWLLEKPGGNPRRLTSAPTTEAIPRVSPDGRTIVFVAGLPNATGKIWRIDADGGNPKPISPGPADGMPLVTRDGRWVLYTAFSPGTRMWRVPIEGGMPELLGGTSSQGQERFRDLWGVAQSPDGRLLAGWIVDQRGFTLALVPLDGSGPREEVQESLPAAGFAYWAPDGRSLYYELIGRAAIFKKTLDESPATTYLDLKDGVRCFFAVSPDGKQLAYAYETVSSDIVLIRDARDEEAKK